MADDQVGAVKRGPRWLGTTSVVLCAAGVASVLIDRTLPDFQRDFLPLLVGLPCFFGAVVSGALGLGFGVWRRDGICIRRSTLGLVTPLLLAGGFDLREHLGTNGAGPNDPISQWHPVPWGGDDAGAAR